MEKNMGSTDKIIRVLIAVLIAVLYWQELISGTTALIAGALAVIFVLTSMISFCPLYLPFGIRTNKK